MSLLQVLCMCSAFGVVCGVAWRLMHRPTPEATLVCRGEWFVWGAAHIVLASASLHWMMDTLIGESPPSTINWFLTGISVTLILLMPSRIRR